MEIKLPTKEERIALHKRGVKMILVTVLLGVLAGRTFEPLFSQPADLRAHHAERRGRLPQLFLLHVESCYRPDADAIQAGRVFRDPG